jgi:hypothetical protein
MARSSLRSPMAALAAILFVSAATAQTTGALKTVDPCSLLTQAEIQQALGKPVQPGKLKANNNPAAGSDCSFTVADYGMFDVLLKPLALSETPARIKAEFARLKMNPVDLPGVGDVSFFTSPGYGMTQLHTIKGARYILFTILVPGATEPAQKTAAEKLMRTLLPRL